MRRVALRNRQIEKEIELEAIGLDIGESVGDIVCPFCNGGRSGERKFGITRTDTGLLYNCYRASCPDGRGFIATRGDLLPGERQAPKSKWKGPYRGEFRQLTGDDREYFLKRFDLGPDYTSFVGSNGLNQYVLEVRTMDGYIRGYIVRRGCWSGSPACPRSAAAEGPKSRAYTSNDGDLLLSWHKPVGDDVGWVASRKLVIVEDQISAAKIAQAGLVGVALTGSYLGEDKVKEIAMWRPNEVTIALDADATGAAFRAARTWGLAFRSIRVLPLQKDIKDMKRTDVQELVK